LKFVRSLGVVMMAKISFVSGFALGLLAGSKIGPGLYGRVSSAASSLATNPRVRQRASTAGDKAAHAAKAAGSTAAQQVKHAGEMVAHRFGDRFGEHRPSETAFTNAASNGTAHGGADRLGDNQLGE
jgi:hypothetical protein